MDWERQVFLQKRAEERLAAILDYVDTPGKMCRSRTLEAYFGETSTKECGKCDYCLRKANPSGAGQIRELSTAILAYIGDLEMEMRDLVENVPVGTREARLEIIREMLDKGILKRGEGMTVKRAQ